MAPTRPLRSAWTGSASIDPIFRQLYFEEKKNYKIPVTAPDLSPKTVWYYQNSSEVNQIQSIRQNAARQRHIDQSQSFNLYVHNKIKAKDLLNLHMEAWKNQLKTIYYTRSTSGGSNDDAVNSRYQECESCT